MQSYLLLLQTDQSNQANLDSQAEYDPYSYGSYRSRIIEMPTVHITTARTISV